MARQMKEKGATEAEPVLEHPPAIPHVRDAVPALPPELRETERELGEPEERESDHAESIPVPIRPAADSRANRGPKTA